MSKQKTSKTTTTKTTSSGSKLTKAELEAIAVEFREELQKVLQVQKGLQESTEQEFETLRTGIHRLEQAFADFDSRAHINEKQLQTVGEMSALTQQRLDKELETLSEGPWEAACEELRGALAVLDASVQSRNAELKAGIDEALLRIAALESQIAEQAATMPRDLGQDILALATRLDARLDGLEEVAETGAGRLAGLEQQQEALADKFRDLNTFLPGPVPGAATQTDPGAAFPAETSRIAQNSAKQGLHQARLLWNGQRYSDPHVALDCLTSALEADPENPELLNERGLAMADAGFPDKAIADFSRAILQDASMAATFHNRGLLYMQMDNREMACRDFRSAAALGDSRALRMAQETGYCGGSVFKKLFRGVID